MNRRVLKFAALAVAVYLAGLLALFPASPAIAWFAPPTPGLALGPARGTIWNGSVASVEYRGWNAGAAAWTLKPRSLLGLAVAADVVLERAGQGPLSASLRATSAGRIEITDLRGAVTLDELARAKLLPANVASGEVILNITRLELLDGRLLHAEGKGGLVNLRSALLPGVPLGDYEGEITTTDNVVIASFRDVTAPVRVAGQAQIQPDGSYTVSGSITPTNETPESLRRGLALLGQPDASGRYSFGFSGRL